MERLLLSGKSTMGHLLKPPHTLGAGAKLIRTAIPDAVVDYRLERDGARCKIELPLGQKISKI
jgi:hypothetical protein